EEIKKEVKNGLAEDIGKDAEEEIQKLHDKYIKKIDEMFAAKEKEILTI
ncbi:MAG: ribosome recycling factor, partial [Bacteroidales bacterium]|nr:ribosome recycling factor [Bacteroidales bacterium]